MGKKLIYFFLFIAIFSLELELLYQTKAGTEFAAIVLFITILAYGAYGWEFLFGHDKK